MSQGQVDVIAAQHQMVANRNAGQPGLLFARFNFDQGKIGGTATNVADQQQTNPLQLLFQMLIMPPEPVITDRLRLFQQTNLRQSGEPCRFDGQRAGRFIKRCRYRQYQRLLFQWVSGKMAVPGGAKMRQVGCTGSYR